MELLKLFEIAEKTDPDWSPTDCLAKLLEESGELSEAVMIESGKSTYKSLKHTDQVIEEAADTIICIIDTVAKQYRGQVSPQHLSSLLESWIDRKSSKWIKVSN